MKRRLVRKAKSFLRRHPRLKRLAGRARDARAALSVREAGFFAVAAAVNAAAPLFLPWQAALGLFAVTMAVVLWAAVRALAQLRAAGTDPVAVSGEESDSGDPDRRLETLMQHMAVNGHTVP
ncbi:hypothetical protein [Salininema proteolyticum]|uniref:Phage holin family protein n=1 Tax=Salininema proteolyticum TaxID=1607685 RepID=A0ABV8U234_9ACTN